MEVSEVEHHTRIAIPEWAEADLSFRPIEKGGSGRLFVRVTNPQDGQSVIAMHYSDDRSDNARFASITDFLNRHDIAAPGILARREELSLLWVTDLGEIDLGTLVGQDWETERRPAYESALRVVHTLHSIKESDAPDDLPELELSFDEALYEWEQQYFAKHFLAELPHSPGSSFLAAPEMVALRRDLAKLPRALVHRDFQSTNVMLQGNDAFLIDYQGLRWGLPEYDLASLIYDPYTDFTPEQQSSLIDFYGTLSGVTNTAEETEAYHRRLHHCAMQRLMQALGAYGFLSRVKGKTEFLQHIPAGTRRLSEIAGGPHGIPLLHDLLVDAS
ncbi:MAG: phosphotransferase [Verrucomicrobiales bacterium]|nr:phosphotransferase [Verrucomicrobiales bacterium]